MAPYNEGFQDSSKELVFCDHAAMDARTYRMVPQAEGTYSTGT